MAILTFLLRKSKRVVILATIAGLVAGIGSTSLVTIVNEALNRDSDKMSLVLGFAAICLLVFVTKASSQMLLIRLGQDALFELRMYLSRQILASPLRQLEKIGPAHLLACLTDDVATITNTLLGIPYICINGSIVIGCLGYLVWLSPPVFLAVVVVIVLGIISYQLPIAKAMQFFNLAREDQDAVFARFRALTAGIKELKLNQRKQEAFFVDELQAVAEAHRKHGFAAMIVYSLAGSWGQLLYFILIGCVLFALPLVVSVEHPILSGYVLVVLYMMSPIEVIMGWLPGIGRANVAIKKLESLGLLLVTSEKLVEPLPLEVQWRQVELVNAVHTYYREDDGSCFTLGPIDLHLQPGELLFLIGGNGSGKTTLAKMLAGLYKPEAGNILMNGERITDENRVWYRQHFAVVFSDFFLFDRLLGLTMPDLQNRTQEHLHQFQLDHKVTIDDGVFSTTDLSQGQRKRLALLTAYLEDRPIYIFDEWAADQDPIFRELFYKQFLPDLKNRGKCVLVISHDDRYYNLADRIVKLDRGKIEAVYDELPTRFIL